MPTREEILERHFKLLDNPFDPKTDPTMVPPFNFAGRSLRQALRIYRHQELGKFFARVGSFQSAAAGADRFFIGWNAAQGPPSTVLCGPSHGGLDSMAGYIAWHLKNKATATARFDAVKIINDSYSSFLEQIDFVMRTHIKEAGIAGCTALFEIADQRQGISEAIITQLFTSLATRLEDAPWLVLMLRPITYKRISLIEKSWELLTSMRIAPVFMTSDPDVWMKFEGWNPASVLSLKVDALNYQQALELLVTRLAQFRVNSQSQVAPEFPYVDADLKKLFADGDQPIGFLLDRYHGAFEEKLTSLANQGVGTNPSPAVDWSAISAQYQQQLKNVAMKANQ